MKTLIASALALAMLTGAAQADVSGTWRSQSGKTQVRIAPAGGGYVGTIVATSVRSACSAAGTRMISMRGSGREFAGQLVNPENCKTYKGKLQVLDDNRLKLSGCVVGGLFCRSQVWTRVK